MHISNLIIQNFRKFGADSKKLNLPLNSGLTTLVGENDEGKSAIIDALRFVLGTKDQMYNRIEESDFHKDESSKVADHIWIQVKFSNLSVENKGAFIEYLDYEEDGSLSLYVNWTASRSKARKWANVNSGKDNNGPTLDADVRSLLLATYLRPLRDANAEMSSGRNSRLSQILSALGDVRETKDLSNKKLLEVSDEAFAAIQSHPALDTTKTKLNDMLSQVSFKNDILVGEITVNQISEDKIRLKQLLEKLNLDLTDVQSSEQQNRGLGSNNLLFMGCEMLLLESANEELPIMLIEEPEAHLHPQRQLVVIEYLQSRARASDIQIIVTTHSPLLASVVNLENMVLIKDQGAFPLGSKYTALEIKDYEFLERFLNSTRANLFFAKGVLLVEGDAENILLPTLAKLIGHDFAQHGVSVVNIGHTGLSRYARIFQRRNGDGKVINTPVACLPDTDIYPDCAPDILELNLNAKRKWKHLGELKEGELAEKKASLKSRSEGQNVKSFPSELWTLEYDLAKNGLLEEMWAATIMAQNDGKASSDRWKLISQFTTEIEKLEAATLSMDEKCVHCYSRFTNRETDYAPGKSKISKSIAAQYFAGILEAKYKNQPEVLQGLLPSYIVEAIKYITSDISGDHDA